VYRVTPDLGTISLLIGDFILPNGLAFSPDESVLYINDTRRGHIWAFDLMPNGTLAKQTDRIFVDLRGSEPGVPDGMKVDVEGNVYCGGAGVAEGYDRMAGIAAQQKAARENEPD
jgi:gluconolactonase